jgi:hypothetical protein
MAATDEMVAIACRLKPEMAMLVPEGRHEVTTEGGLDIVAQEEKLKQAVDRLADAGIISSVFIDADLRQVEALVADLERDLKRIGFSSVRAGWALKEEAPSLPEPGRLYMHPLFWAVLASAIVAFVQLGFWRSLVVCIGGFAGYGVAHFVVARDKTSPSNPLRCRRR